MKVIRRWLTMLSCGVGLAACGLSTGASTDTTVEITGTVLMPTGITGTVQAPISSNTSKQRRLASRHPFKAVQLTEAAATDLTCSLYTLSGTLLGSAATNAAGEVAFTVSQSQLGTTAQLALRCTDTAGRIHLEGAAVTSVSTATTSIALGTVDATSTQAAIGLRAIVGCDWSTSTCVLPSGVDLGCALSAERATSRTASLDDTNTSQRMALLNMTGAILMTSDFDPTSIGFADMAALLTALHRADGVTAAGLDAIAAVVATPLGSDAATIASALANADDTSAAIDQAVGSVLAGTVGQSTLGAAESLCTRVAADETAMNAVVVPMLSAASSTAVSTTYTQAGSWGVIINTVNALESASDAATLSERTGLLDAYLQSFSGDFSTVYDATAGSVDTLTPSGLVEVLRSVDGAATLASQQEFLEGWHGVIAALDGWSTLFTGGTTFDDSLADYIDAHFADAEFDPDTFNFDAFAVQVSTIDLDAADTCEALEDYDAMIACYEAIYGDFSADDESTTTTTTFAVSSVSPTDESTATITSTFSVSATFNSTVDTTTIDQTSLVVYAISESGSIMHLVTGTAAYDSSTLTLTFSPVSSTDFISGTRYQAVVNSNVSDMNGTPLASAYSWEFTTL